ncbi:NVEALA domain-containing protein [uncultured Mediterranea sp.]|uniref:NVEALA domain-containing protein n=1 Tax=uncultured Mediterranea sp. TaxID=1926662 RepID=UPI0027D9C1AC|nr:NVEALA domain-containing protein [uncultured Mediterranea sp.]
MKKLVMKISIVFAGIALVSHVAYSNQEGQNPVSNLTLENIEALGSDETDPSMPSQYPAYKGELNNNGNFTRYRYSDGTCHAKYMINPKRDGYCRNE